MSPSRIHQVLKTDEPAKIPAWITAVREEAARRSQGRLAAEVRLLPQCIRWLQQLEWGEDVVVNLRPETDEETEYVRFDRPRVVRILERITADLDQLAQGGDTQYDDDSATQHRKQLAEPPPATRRLPAREIRNSLRAELKLAPK